MIEDKSWVCDIILKKQNRAYYSPSNDLIVCPVKNQFPNHHNFYSVLLHEMCHSSSKEERLNRAMGKVFGDNEYAREEVIAELTAAFVGTQLGIFAEPSTESVTYLNGWIKVLKQSPDFIFSLLDAGPSRPQDKILLKDFKDKFIDLLDTSYQRQYISWEQRDIDKSITRFEGEGGDLLQDKPKNKDAPTEIESVQRDGLKTVWITRGQEKFMLSDGAVAIAAITSCTNTSNPFVMIGAGLVARNARKHGIDVKPWVKTSLAPGSKVVTDYLEKADLMKDLEALQFHLVGYGCTSCIGNSGPLAPDIAKVADDQSLVLTSVLSGNRNFEARIHSQVKMNFLMSPMLVVAYAIAGRVDIDLINEPISYDSNMNPVYLKDIWPTDDEINEIMSQVLTPKDFEKNYGNIFEGNETWRNLEIPSGKLYEWNENSTYIKEIPFFHGISSVPEPLQDIKDARALLVLGDSVTTDHISPAGSFNEYSAAGKYLIDYGVAKKDFNSYGSRRGNDELMVRGTFSNVRIKNQLAKREGGYTCYLPEKEEMTVYDAAMKYKEDNTPLVIQVSQVANLPILVHKS